MKSTSHYSYPNSTPRNKIFRLLSYIFILTFLSLSFKMTYATTLSTNNLQKKITRQKTKIKKAEDKIKKAEDKIINANRQIQNAKVVKKEAKVRKAKVRKAKIKRLNTKIKRLNTKIKRHNAKIKRLNTKIKRHNAKIKRLNAQISKARPRISQLEIRVTLPEPKPKPEQVSCNNCPVIEIDKVITLLWDAAPSALEGYQVYIGDSVIAEDMYRLDDVLVSGMINPAQPSIDYFIKQDLQLSSGDYVCFRIKAFTEAGGVSFFSEPVCEFIP